MNAKSWQARGLLAWYAMQGSGSKLWDLSPRKNHGDLQAAASIEWSGQLGQPVLRAKIGSGSGNNGVRIPNLYGSTSTEGTLLLYIRNFGNNIGAPVDYTTDFNVHHYPYAGVGGGDNGNILYCNALHTNRINVNDWLPNKDAWHWYVIKTKNGTNNWQWWQDGRKIAQQNGQTNLPNVTSAARRVLASNSHGSQGWGGFMAEARFYDYWWPDEQIIRLAKCPLDRFELYQPVSNRVWFIPDQTQHITPGALSVPPTLASPQVGFGVAPDALTVSPSIPNPSLGVPLAVTSPVNVAPVIFSPQVGFAVAPDVLSQSVTINAPHAQLVVDANSLALAVNVLSPSVGSGVYPPLMMLSPTMPAPSLVNEGIPISPIAVDKRTLKVLATDKRTIKVR